MTFKIKTGRKPRTTTISNKYIKVRTTDEEREFLNEKARKAGAKNLSEWIRKLMDAA